jgi:hypothetical protein
MMETQQMMELLLARMNASIKEHMQEMTARMDSNTKAMKDEIKEDMNANREIDREERKAERKAYQQGLKKHDGRNVERQTRHLAWRQVGGLPRDDCLPRRDKGKDGEN